jgi:hypothetical protein
LVVVFEATNVINVVMKRVPLMRCCRVADQCQTAARERLATSLTAVKAGAAAAAEAAAGQHARHMESLLQLKVKADEVRDATAKNAEKTR